MAIVDRPRGLRPRRTLRGQVDFNQQILPTGGSNLNSIFLNDIVTLDAAGHVAKWPDHAGAATAASTDPIGVAVALYDSNKRPFTHNQPSTGQLIPPNTTGFVGVAVDPDVIFTAQWDTSLGESDVGQFVTVTAGSGVTALGQSGQEIVGAVSSGPSKTHVLQVIGIADDLDDPAANNDIEVRFATHQYVN